jgi:hypothetical protein
VNLKVADAATGRPLSYNVFSATLCSCAQAILLIGTTEASFDHNDPEGGLTFRLNSIGVQGDDLEWMSA